MRNDAQFKECVSAGCLVKHADNQTTSICFVQRRRSGLLKLHAWLYTGELRRSPTDSHLVSASLPPLPDFLPLPGCIKRHHGLQLLHPRIQDLIMIRPLLLCRPVAASSQYGSTDHECHVRRRDKIALTNIFNKLVMSIIALQTAKSDYLPAGNPHRSQPK